MTKFTEIPYDRLVGKMCGKQWRNLSGTELDAAWGIAIVKSVLDGVRPELHEISRHLGVERQTIHSAFQKLNMNGVFQRGRIYSDKKALLSEDQLAWGYYGGYASASTGCWMPR